MIAKPKVLMIDNARMMHGAVKARLAANGMEFHSAYSGDEGLSQALAIQPDVILLDVEMPAPNGFEVCRRIKSNAALANTPVIFLTAVTSTEEKVRGLNLGAIDYVTKPFDAAELQARVRAALRNKELLDLLSRKAMIDGHTGLYNRDHFNQRLKEELAYAKRRAHPLSCILLDIDHFKLINDTHGHGFGDAVLKGVADVIQALSRSEDIVCRYGGEEFAILARETAVPAAAMFAERLRKRVECLSVTQGGISVAATVSIGVSDLTDGEDGVVERADRALYISKRAGRNRITVFKESSEMAA